jgi:hypothetical protein
MAHGGLTEYWGTRLTLFTALFLGVSCGLFFFRTDFFDITIRNAAVPVAALFDVPAF